MPAHVETHGVVVADALARLALHQRRRPRAGDMTALGRHRTMHGGVECLQVALRRRLRKHSSSTGGHLRMVGDTISIIEDVLRDNLAFWLVIL